MQTTKKKPSLIFILVGAVLAGYLGYIGRRSKCYRIGTGNVIYCAYVKKNVFYKSEFVCEKSVNKRMLICVACGNGSFECRVELSKSRRQRLC